MNEVIIGSGRLVPKKNRDRQNFGSNLRTVEPLIKVHIWDDDFKEESRNYSKFSFYSI